MRELLRWSAQFRLIRTRSCDLLDRVLPVSDRRSTKSHETTPRCFADWIVNSLESRFLIFFLDRPKSNFVLVRVIYWMSHRVIERNRASNCLATVSQEYFSI
jgi:hypothetical protein